MEPKNIPDADAKKPEDWVNDAEILDETDKKNHKIGIQFQKQ